MTPQSHIMYEFSIILWWGLRAPSFENALGMEELLRDLCLPLRLHQDQWSRPFCLLLHVPGGKHRSEASSSTTEGHHFKNPSDLCDNKWCLFPCWGLVYRETGWRAGPSLVHVGQAVYHWEATPTRFISLKSPLACSTDMHILPWSPADCPVTQCLFQTSALPTSFPFCILILKSWNQIPSSRKRILLPMDLPVPYPITTLS